jgi:hypothetical protein
MKASLVEQDIRTQRHIIRGDVNAVGSDQIREHLALDHLAGREFETVFHQPDRLGEPDRFAGKADTRSWHKPPEQWMGRQLPFTRPNASEEFFWLKGCGHPVLMAEVN